MTNSQGRDCGEIYWLDKLILVQPKLIEERGSQKGIASCRVGKVAHFIAK